MTAKLAKVEITEEYVSDEQAKSKEFKGKSLTGKFPLLETENGTLVESAAIARYFARLSGSDLNGKDNFENAKIDQFIDFAQGSILPHCYVICKAIFGWAAVDTQTYNEALKEIKEAIRLLNVHLQGKQYLVGDRLTVADIVVAFSVLVPFQVAIDAGARKSIASNVEAWILKFLALPEVVKRIGNIKLCSKAMKVAAPPKKEEKKPAAAPKKEEKKVEAPKKAIDPLDELPPSKFDLNDFKNFFVNVADKRGEGMKYLLDNYDKDGYSLYYAKYDKYEGEGEVLYQTANLMNGFLQRMDYFRKHVFGVMAITGQEPDLDIESAWLVRGKGIP